MLPSAGAALLHRPVQRWRGNPVDTALLFHDGVMDDEDDRRLLDFIGDVQALNEYLHGSNSKSIGEDDVTNAAYGSASSFFTGDTGSSSDGLKDDHNHLGEFGEAGAADLQLSGNLSFIDDELEGGSSPSDVDLGCEDQPFDILQKSLLEADITEQTLAQEALLDSQPSLIPTATTFPQQLVSGGFGGVAGPGVVAPLPVAGVQPQTFIQQVPQLPLPSGPTGHIQVVGPFNGSASSMMTINSLEQPQILLRPSGNVVANNSGQGAMFAPTAPNQMSMSFNKGTIPVQNIIIQRGPGQQTLVRPIQPKPLQTGAQTVYNISNIGLQPSTTATANFVSSQYTTSGSPQTAQQVKVVNPASSIVMHSPLGQQAQSQSNLPQGQFLVPSSISLTTGTTVHGFQAVNGQVIQTNTQGGDPMSTTTYSILTNQNTAVQLIPGQNFSAGGQLIVNQGLVGGNQIGQASPTPVVQVSQRPGATAKVWTASVSPNPNPVQTSQSSGHLTVVNSGVQGPQVCQQLSVNPGQHLLMPVAQSSPVSSGVQEFQQITLNQDMTTAQTGQTQLLNLLGTKAVKTLTPASQESPLTPKRPATQQLTRGGMVYQQLRRDHSGVMSPERTPFSSVTDVIDKLLPYHVFQGSPPRDEEFTKVEEEFEAVATRVLEQTQVMVNKYRRLLMVEAERSSPSSEMVMIDRTFNQEERSNLTQDKRMILVDPDGYLEDFCCGPKKRIPSPEVSLEGNPSGFGTSQRLPVSHTGRDGQRMNSHREPAYRTDSQPEKETEEHRRSPIKCILNIKKIKSNISSSQHAHYPASPSQSKHSPAQAYPSGRGRSQEQQLSSDHSHTSLADTDSVLEAAVNSILEC